MKQKILIWLGAIIILAIVGSDGYIRYTSDVRGEKERTELENRLMKELGLSTTCEKKVDSLTIANTRLSAFENLTLAMVHREDATKGLDYEVGDIVYLKSDSSKVVISDILIGGGKYNYFIKYRVLFKDDTTKELVPELIY